MWLTTKMKDQLNLKVEGVTYNMIMYIDIFLNAMYKVYDTAKITKGVILNEIILKAYHGEPVEYMFRNIKYDMKDIYIICNTLDRFVYDFVYYNNHIDREVANIETFINNSEFMNTQSNENIQNKFHMQDYEIVALKTFQYNINVLKIENSEAMKIYISQIMYGYAISLEVKNNPIYTNLYDSILKLYNDFKNTSFIEELIYTIFNDKYVGDLNYPNIDKWFNNLMNLENNI